MAKLNGGSVIDEKIIKNIKIWIEFIRPEIRLPSDS